MLEFLVSHLKFVAFVTHSPGQVPINKKKGKKNLGHQPRDRERG
jgi:hypothetical protein